MMQKTILIPTDFTIESLTLMKRAAQLAENETIDIVFMYSSYLPDSIPELLFYSDQKVLKNAVTSDFKEAVSILKNKYSSKIVKIDYSLFNGINKNAMQIFLDAKNIDEVFVPQTYVFKTKGKSFNPVPLLKKCHQKVYEIDWIPKKNLPEKDQLAELFLD